MDRLDAAGEPVIVAALVVAASLNPCDLLTKQEVAAVQGEAYTEAKPSRNEQISQCFYQLPTFTKSVSVGIIGGNAREFWRVHFEGEGESESAPPRRIGGVGEKAYWTGNRLTGALYVLRGDAILRVSVGGPGSEQQKIAKSKRLAKRALRRM